MNWQILGLVAVVALINAVATVKVLRSELLTPRQRLLQTLFIWIVPVVGAIVCLAAIAADKPGQDQTRNPNFHPADAHWDDTPSPPGTADGD